PWGRTPGTAADPGRVRISSQTRAAGANEAAGDAIAQPRGRLYDEAVRQALPVLWDAGDRICGKRLRALIPVLIEAMERRGYLQLDWRVRSRFLRVSARPSIGCCARCEKQLGEGDGGA